MVGSLDRIAQGQDRMIDGQGRMIELLEFIASKCDELPKNADRNP